MVLRPSSSDKKIRLGYNCFIALNQVQTVCPLGLHILLQMTAPMNTSNTRASAAPAPHSRAIDEEEAEEGEQKTNVIGLGKTKTKKSEFEKPPLSSARAFSPAGVASRVRSREAGSGGSSDSSSSAWMFPSSRIGPRAAVPSHCTCGGKPARPITGGCRKQH